MKTITSRANPGFKALLALAGDTRTQRKQGQTLLDGIHLVDTYLRQGGTPEQLLVSESGLTHPEVSGLLKSFPAFSPVLLRDELFRELVDVVQPVGIAALIAIPRSAALDGVSSCVVLDAVQDSGNVGSILRSAAAAGIAQIVLGKGCAGAWSPRVLRAGQGAHFALRIHEQLDLPDFLAHWPGKSVATVVEAEHSIYDLDLKLPLAWLFGSEGSGLAPELASAATYRATIPLAAATESLNVAAAAAVCFFEAVRQQKA